MHYCVSSHTRFRQLNPSTHAKNHTWDKVMWLMPSVLGQTFVSYLYFFFYIYTQKDFLSVRKLRSKLKVWLLQLWSSAFKSRPEVCLFSYCKQMMQSTFLPIVRHCCTILQVAVMGPGRNTKTAMLQQRQGRGRMLEMSASNKEKSAGKRLMKKKMHSTLLKKTPLGK